MRTLVLLLLLTFTAQAQAQRLTVVELYTSQGCSSCPPADAALRRMAQTDPTILPLDLHITYWDRLGWKDPFSLPAATERQRAVAARLNLDSIYTPQMVVDGRYQAVGSDPQEVARALAAARANKGPAVPLTLSSDAGGLRLHAGAGPGHGTLLLLGFDPEHTTPVRAGENDGRTLTEVNVVRSMAVAATWDGAPLDLVLHRPAGTRAAVLLQAPDGHILAAAALR